MNVDTALRQQFSFSDDAALNTSSAGGFKLDEARVEYESLERFGVEDGTSELCQTYCSNYVYGVPVPMSKVLKLYDDDGAREHIKQKLRAFKEWLRIRSTFSGWVPENKDDDLVLVVTGATE